MLVNVTRIGQLENLLTTRFHLGMVRVPVVSGRGVQRGRIKPVALTPDTAVLNLDAKGYGTDCIRQLPGSSQLTKLNSPARSSQCTALGRAVAETLSGSFSTSKRIRHIHLICQLSPICSGHIDTQA